MAKIKQVLRNILILRYTQEKDDDDYGSCLWADFLFDLDEYQLNINSDCGSFSYGWVVSPKEPFLKLMTRIEHGYLLSKIARESRVDAKATMEGLEELLQQELERGEIDEFDAASISRRWTDVVYCTDEADFLPSALLLEISGDCWEPSYEGLNCAIQVDYPVYAKKIAEIFQRFVRPKIRELLEQEARDVAA